MGSITVRRIVLGLFIAVGLFHAWGYFAPETWYRTFPGIGRGWLERLGPYNEHLMKDYVSMFMAMTVLTVAAWRYVDSDRFVQTAGLSWLTFNVFHLIYHVQHLDMYSTGEKITMVSVLSLLTLASAVLLAPAPRAKATADDEGQVFQAQ
ncbi:hypothetical protein IQ210_32105 [Streptomyces sp. 3R004]|nr:hypothetical protein [Streptomyces justiciae]